ncbi:MAG: TlpA disulfide reductase family protein [Saprospiraceae bacterium]
MLFLLGEKCWCQVTKFKPVLPVKSEASERLRDMEFTDLSGRHIKLNDFLGKPVLLNFWASWCGPCKQEMQSISAISKIYENNLIVILASDENIDIISKYKNESALNLNFVKLNSSFIDAYIVKLPTTLLISRSGKLVLEEEGFRDWTSKNNFDKVYDLTK